LISRPFLVLALVLLLLGALFGILGIWQYIEPGLARAPISFDRVRPLHVSAVIFWILTAAVGVVYAFLQEHLGKPLRYPWLAWIQFGLFAITFTIILSLYTSGKFGGREYWEFPPVLALPIAVGWIAFLVNLFATIGLPRQQPVYVWMWLTGGIFFLFTFTESYLWVFPHFRSHVINDMTVQWKSYGSMVGAWNMLIYGSGIWLMARIGGDDRQPHSRLAFLLYFTGLFNLMFNWGHHIYTLPTHRYIQYISYAVSMTELFILGRIIWTWRASVTEARRHFHRPAYRFLLAADAWIFLNLVLAIGMSIPAINVFTHGTHVTVAHSMGTTVGINTFLLLAMVTYFVRRDRLSGRKVTALAGWGLGITNVSLLLFWLGLILAGILRAAWQMSADPVPFADMMFRLRPVFALVAVTGTTLAIGLWILGIPLLKGLATRPRPAPPYDDNHPES